jgi:hypothetical protein
MLEQIIKEKISSDHLLYVSLKYTKTCDVILNLIRRWSIMIDHSIEGLLIKAKKNKKLKVIPLAPRQKTELLKKTFKKEKKVIDAIELYELFKRIDKLPKTRENEFRKGVRIKVQDNGNEVVIDLEKLKEYAQILEDFINYVKQYLLS